MRFSMITLSGLMLAAAACSDDGGGDEGSGQDGDFLVGVVSDVGRFNDKGFNQLALEGCQRAESELGIECRALESRSTSDYVPNFARLARGVGMMRGHGAPYGAALYLDGQADAWTEGNVSLWDIAPFVVLFEEAGARFTDLTGRRGWPYRSGLAAAPALHAALLALAHGATPHPSPAGGSTRA